MALKTLLASEDLGALLLGPSFLPADPMVPLLDQDEEEALSLSSSLEGSSPASPAPTLSSSSSSLSPYQTLCSSPLSSSSSSSPFSSSSSSSLSPPASPLSSPSSFLEPALGEAGLSFPWLGDAELLHADVGADAERDDPFSGMDWMAEKIDLGDFDLDSLMDHCPSDGAPGSPEDLLATLDPQMDLALDPFASPVASPLDARDLLPLPPLGPSPVPPAASPGEGESTPLSPPPLEPGSVVDVSEVDRVASGLTVVPAPAGIPQTPPTTASFLVSLTAAGPYLMFLTAKAEPGLIPALLPSSADQPPPADEASPPAAAAAYTLSLASSDSDSDSGIESASGTPPRSSSPSAPSSPAGSSRTKPYSRPEPPGAPRPGRVKPAGGGGPPRVVEKKLKKMEQNKTAATRYRQKKRVEQEVLSVECDELEAKNHTLEERVEALSREIKYLRDLMEEVRNAKNRRGKPVSA